MRRFSRLLKLRNKSGFTLVEVIVSCALLGILIISVLGMITPVMSVVMNNEKNANALMIAEATEAYIDRNIKNSVFVAIFTNANPSDILSATIDEHEAVKEMKAFLNDGDNKDIYDLKIIGIRWLEDPKTHHYKYMLNNLKPRYDSSFNLVGGAGLKCTNVFEPCFYDNLYPNISFEVMPYNEYEDNDKTKPIVSTKNAALKTTIDVYSNSAMTALAASGEGYADLINIRTPAINRGDIYKLYSIEGGNDAMGNPITLTTQIRTADEFAATFPSTNPETYIFYVTRKLKYYEAPPATP
ncbi:MAG: type II secretion system GspH family protein [Oscillospiraceae bacterium]|nr:type II secretion system GspH family protein [Oscillospiraceae bacterium]